MKKHDTRRKKAHTTKWQVVLTSGLYGRVDPGDPPPSDPQPPSPPPSDPLEKARFEADQARAQLARITKELEDLKRQVPSQDQRAKWAELEQQQQVAEEQRRRKEGEFDQWRLQIQEKHSKELEAVRSETQNTRALAEATERELNDTHVTNAFYGAVEWFGPTGKTTMMPDMAKAYFAQHVEVETVPAPNGGPGKKRRVVVRDHSGTVIVDPKTGQPMPFDKAIGELIDTHPNKAYLLRNSGRAGSGSAGGNGDDVDMRLDRLKASDFKRQDVRDRVRDQLAAPGGIQVGPAFDTYRRGQRSK